MSDQDLVQGHWVRDWIKAPGFEDHTTRVHWMQVGSDYADVRIPADRPALSDAEALHDLSAPDLLRLARAEGFAGQTTLAGARCTWHREINWHGTPDIADVGDISFDEQGRMIEAGVLSAYTELWERQPGDDPDVKRFQGDGYSGIVVSRGEVAVLGIGQTDKPATTPVIEALEAGQIPEGIDRFFDGIHALCHWSGHTLIADLATQPFSEGLPVLRNNGTTFTWTRIAFDGTETDVTMRVSDPTS